MSTLATMRDEVKANLAIVGSTQDTAIDGFIRAALRSVRQKRYWFLRRKQNLTLSSGGYSASLPSNFSVIDTANLLYDGKRYTREYGFAVVDYADLLNDYMPNTTRDSGRPLACAIGFSSDIETDKTADQNCVIELMYFAQDATLPTNDSDTSVWFDDGFDFIRSSAQLLFALENEGDTETPAAAMSAFRQRLDEKHEFYQATGQV